MRAALPVCAGIAVICGIVAGKLWLELRSERQVIEGLRAQLNDAGSRGQQSMSPVSATVATPSFSGVAPSAQAPASESSQVTAAAQRGAAPATGPAMGLRASLGMTSEEELMKDPEYRKSRLAMARIQIAHTYPGLVEELGLTEKEAEEFFTMMAENQTKLSMDIGTARNGDDMAALARRQAAAQKEQEDAIRAMMGTGRYEQYQAYMQTRSARNQVVNMGSQLAAAGAPLSEAQSRSLTAAMIAEQQRQPATGPNVNASPGQPRTAQSVIEEIQNRQEDSNRRLLETAGPQLNARQLAVLKEQVEQQNAARRDALSRAQVTVGPGGGMQVLIQGPPPQQQ